MQSLNRKPFQGLWNVIKFNWHFYMLAFCVIIILLISKSYFNHSLQLFISIFILLSLCSIFISLFATYYLYDHSNLYTLDWLKSLQIKTGATIINIHAGFDETSNIINEKFLPSNFMVYDFYDPKKHTEISIKRARKNADVYPRTIAISNENFQIDKASIDYIFLFLAAHEIRNIEERILFFQKLKSSLNKDGKIIVVEHLRNVSNFVAYNIGAFHFHPKKQWMTTFKNAGFDLISEIKLNSFISAFVLNNHEAST